MRRRCQTTQAELSLHDTSRGALTCAGVWELTDTNGCGLQLQNHFSGELRRPIPWLRLPYGLSSLTELPPPREKSAPKSHANL